MILKRKRKNLMSRITATGTAATVTKPLTKKIGTTNCDRQRTGKI